MLKTTPDPETTRDPNAVERALSKLQPRASAAWTRLTRRAGWLALVYGVLAALQALARLPAGVAVVALLLATAIAAFLRSSRDEFDAYDAPPWIDAAERPAPLVAEPDATAAPAPSPSPPAPDGWRLVIDALPGPAVALDWLGQVAHANAMMRELFPRVRDGIPFSNVTRNPELMDALDRARIVGESISVDMIERVPMDRRFSVSVARLTTARTTTGLPTHLITFRDLSEQDRLDQMRADFVANASHELRTPLASLRGFVETLQGPARDDPAARDRFLGLMASQAMRMTRLIDDLLSLSRVEMRAHLPPRGIVDLNEVAAYVKQTLEPLGRADRIEIALHRLDTPARIRGDREEIVQVVQNLVHNAIKYGRADGRVDVRIERASARPGAVPRLTLTVIDDGLGIAPEHLPRLTERFYRVNAASSREKGGTGLGLAIVKHIVLRHRGELRIASQPGIGSRFVVDFDELAAGAASA
jgi:two-component system phosphate regulon sensor histidine kinase PhoR